MAKRRVEKTKRTNFGHKQIHHAALTATARHVRMLAELIASDTSDDVEEYWLNCHHILVCEEALHAYEALVAAGFPLVCPPRRRE